MTAWMNLEVCSDYNDTGAKGVGLLRARDIGLSIPPTRFQALGDAMALQGLDLQCPMLLRPSACVPWDHSDQVSGIGESVVLYDTADLSEATKLVARTIEAMRSGAEMTPEWVVLAQPHLEAMSSGFLQVGHFSCCGIACTSRVISTDGRAGRVAAGTERGVVTYLTGGSPEAELVGLERETEGLMASNVIPEIKSILGRIPAGRWEIEWIYDGRNMWIVQYQPLSADAMMDM